MPCTLKVKGTGAGNWRLELSVEVKQRGTFLYGDSQDVMGVGCLEKFVRIMTWVFFMGTFWKRAAIT